MSINELSPTRMVRLPSIDTGERTLCQDKSKNPSSFWLSVAKKDYGDVYRRRASDQYFKVLRSEPEIKSWTYRYSPRSKAAYWDWHYERPADRTPKSKNASTQDFWSPDVSPTDLALKRDPDIDYVKDYSDPEEYAKYTQDGGRRDSQASHPRQRQVDDVSNNDVSLRSAMSPQQHRGDDTPQHEVRGQQDSNRHYYYDRDDVAGRNDDVMADSRDDAPIPNDDRRDFDRLDLDLDRYRHPDDGDGGHDLSSHATESEEDGQKQEGRVSSPEKRQSTYVYKRYNPERYVSETMASYKFHNTPRSLKKQTTKQPALGIVPANEFYEPDPYERMLPRCDRDDTVKMATYPVMTYGRKKKLSELPRGNEVILPDPSPLDFSLQEKSTHRKKYIPGPPDCLKVPGFDGGAPLSQNVIRRQANYENHRSKRSEIQIG